MNRPIYLKHNLSAHVADEHIAAPFREELIARAMGTRRPNTFSSLAYAVTSLFDTCAASCLSDEEIVDILIERFGETPLNPATVDGQAALLMLDCLGRAICGRRK